MSTRVQQKATGLMGVALGMRPRIVKTVTPASLRERSSQPVKHQRQTESQSRSRAAPPAQNAKALPLQDQKMNSIFKTPLKKPANETSTPAPKASSAAAGPASVKRCWRVPTHSGVPAAFSKCQSPAVSKGVTKPRSTTKRRKLPKHSGVPVSLSKNKLALLLIDDE